MLRQEYQQSKVMPKALQTRMDFNTSFFDYLDDFDRVSHNRKSNEAGFERLADTEIEAYMRIYDVPDRAFFHRLMRALDDEYVDSQNRKIAQQRKSRK